jgi:hypothetical protein
MTLASLLFHCIIFNNIKKYLLHDMLRCLADTCTDLRQYKFENIMILNDNASLSYYNDNLFRQTFLDYRKKVIAKYPQFKFGLNLRQLLLDCSINTLHDIFEDVYYIHIWSAKTLTDITALKGIPIVKLFNCTNLKNIGILSHISHKKDSTYKVNKHLLKLDRYYNTKEDYININSFISLALCTAITDFSSLRGIKHIDLESCTQITNSDLIHFSNTITLILIRCYLITDVSELSHLDSLDISGCDNITDVSPLSKLHTLHAQFCRSITNVSALGNLVNLNLTNCYNIYDVSALGKVKKLILQGCYNITDVSALINVKFLNIAGCSQITDIPCFNTEILDLSGCYKITDFSKLINVQELLLQECTQITNNHLQLFKNKRLLDLTRCYNITDVSALINIENLNLSACENITDIPYLQSKKLNLSQCCGIKDFSKVINVKELLLRHCKQITNKDVPFFVDKDFLDLFACTNITNVDILLDNVKVLDLSFCSGITDCSPFADDGINTLQRYYIRKLK